VWMQTNMNLPIENRLRPFSQTNGLLSMMQLSSLSAYIADPACPHVDATASKRPPFVPLGASHAVLIRLGSRAAVISHGTEQRQCTISATGLLVWIHCSTHSCFLALKARALSRHRLLSCTVG